MSNLFGIMHYVLYVDRGKYSGFNNNTLMTVYHFADYVFTKLMFCCNPSLLRYKLKSSNLVIAFFFFWMKSQRVVIAVIIHSFYAVINHLVTHSLFVHSLVHWLLLSCNVMWCCLLCCGRWF